MGTVTKDMVQGLRSNIGEVPGFIDRVEALEKAMCHYQDRVGAHVKRLGMAPTANERLKYWDSLAQPIISEMCQSLQQTEKDRIMKKENSAIPPYVSVDFRSEIPRH